jgi:hypothetical protein
MTSTSSLVLTRLLLPLVVCVKSHIYKTCTASPLQLAASVGHQPNGYVELFPLGYSIPGMELTTQLQIVFKTKTKNKLCGP